MTLHDTYNRLFPPPIARRMVELHDEDSFNTMRPWMKDLPEYVILHFSPWARLEIPEIIFWANLANLYADGATPTEEQIKAVFAAHNTPYE